MIIEFLTAGLLIVTAYYVWQTHKILKEQRKTAELTVAPHISFRFEKNKSLEPLKVEIQCVTMINSLYNLTMKTFINRKCKGEKYLGNAIIFNLEPDKQFQNSDPFDLTEFLKEIEKEKEFILGIEISYESRSGSKIVEKYEWDARITKNDTFYTHETYPKSREIISAPWL